MGGEKVMCNSRDGARLGSPPRGRGKDIKFTCNAGQLRITPAESLDGSLCLRITPAWAGKRFWNRPWVWATSDHPRVGGEKPLYDPAHLGPQGSPPRRRGKVPQFANIGEQPGITPA